MQIKKYRNNNEVTVDVVMKTRYRKGELKIMKTKKIARKKIREVENMLQNLPVTPQTYTLVKMYQVLEELHFQKDYDLVCSICDALLNK